MKDSAKQKDLWDKLDILAKGLLALVVSGGIAFYTFVVQEENRNAQFETQEANRKAQVEQQIASRQMETMIRVFNQRDQSESSLRSNMFATLLENFFEKDDVDSQIVALEMIGLNFRDTLQIKPMFESLNGKLNQKLERDPGDGVSRNQKELLREASRDIIREQLKQIDATSNGNTCNFKLDKSTEIPVKPPCFTQGFRLLETSSDEVEIQAYYLESDFDMRNESRWVPLGESFGVSFFDMPMVDYTIVPNTSIAYAVILLDVEHAAERADLAVAILPDVRYSTRNAYSLDEQITDMIQRDFGNLGN